MGYCKCKETLRLHQDLLRGQPESARRGFESGRKRTALSHHQQGGAGAAAGPARSHHEGRLSRARCSGWQVHERLRAGAEATFIVVRPSEGAEPRTKQNSVLEVAIEGHLLDRSSSLPGFRGVRLFPMAVER